MIEPAKILFGHPVRHPGPGHNQEYGEEEKGYFSRIMVFPHFILVIPFSSWFTMKLFPLPIVGGPSFLKWRQGSLLLHILPLLLR